MYYYFLASELGTIPQGRSRGITLHTVVRPRLIVYAPRQAFGCYYCELQLLLHLVNAIYRVVTCQKTGCRSFRSFTTLTILQTNLILW